MPVKGGSVSNPFAGSYPEIAGPILAPNLMGDDTGLILRLGRHFA